MLPKLSKNHWDILNKSRKQEGKIKFRSRLLNVILKMNKEYKFFFLLLRRGNGREIKEGKKRKKSFFATRIFLIQNMTWCSTFFIFQQIVTFALEMEAKFPNISILKFSGNFVGVNRKLDSISLNPTVSKTMMTKRSLFRRNLIKTDDESFLGESFFTFKETHNLWKWRQEVPV